MFIRKAEYYNLLDCKKMNDELEKEIKRLTLALNTNVKNCKVGPWCENCGHWITDKSVIIATAIRDYTSEDCYYGLPIPEKIGGEVGYCSKNVNTLCPDFIPNKK